MPPDVHSLHIGYTRTEVAIQTTNPFIQLFSPFLDLILNLLTVGYCRVSTHDQHLMMHQDALKSVGCEEIFSDIASGAKSERPGLEEAIAYLREGDTLVVWKLDRLCRSIQHLIQTIQSMRNRGIGFLSLHENIDTTTSGGKLVFHIFGALAEFERLLQLYDEGRSTVSEICKIFGISKSGFYNYLKNRKVSINSLEQVG